MEKEQRKLAFFEIGRGSLAQEMQEEFEHAQHVSRDLNGAVEVTLKIKVHPPNAKIESMGLLDYQISRKDPPKKSALYTTRLVKGFVVQDGIDGADASQTNFLDQLNLSMGEPVFLAGEGTHGR